MSIELRDPIHGPIAVGYDELRVIDAPHFQRLRRIKQLGFAELVFPGAVHNRYLHSIGAMHLAGRAFDALWGGRTRDGLYLRLRQTARFAALLHDIGHPPLSHAAEALLPDRAALAPPGVTDLTGRASHEDMTAKLILDSALTPVLVEAGSACGIAPAHIAALIDDDVVVERETFLVDGRDARPALHGLVSGELDVDRMDYLLRDSTFAGVSYGRYDLDWLMSHLVMLEDDAGWRAAIDIRALPAFEHFLLARYHMFQMVYFHGKSDIYDAMLREWLREVGDDARFPADPEAYVDCDDAWLLRRLRASDNAWAKRIMNQEPLALAAELRQPLPEGQREQLSRELTEAGTAHIFLTAKPVLSRYAQAPTHLRSNPLLVRMGPSVGAESSIARIEDVTQLFERYNQSVRLERLYVTKEARPAFRERLALLPSGG
ncbi:MAG: HD domain-containing protein [Myxococcota bacterium]